MLERRDRVGGAAVSEAPFRGVDARLSRYAYLVSLFPAALLGQLGLAGGVSGIAGHNAAQAVLAAG